ncbi:MAG: hypothetical protein HY010_19690 [Acidobacteria bacterium]|nr:hypothetical protein [Acidobacteriota bacterium]
MLNYRRTGMWLMVFVALALSQAGAQILAGDALKKVVPSGYFFASQSAQVQVRNSVAAKTAAGHIVAAGMVDTSGYSTSIQEKYQGFFITETKVTFDGGSLEPGAYGFGFKDGKFLVMNIAATDLFSVATKADDQQKHPVPMKLEKDGDGYRLYAGKNYVAFKAE